MIKGIGVDFVNIKRMERWCTNQRLLERFFSGGELLYASARPKAMSQTLAARFAAKEAFGKALGTGLAGFELKDVMVENDASGVPHLQVTGQAVSALGKSGANRVHISLSHERDYAIAMIVLESV
jgi:holo-[acyl-carrier protein] synthase